MKAPENVYVRLEIIGSSWDVSTLNNGGEKYIRKEALIEWAKENIDSLGRLSYGELIDKLNSM